MQTKSNCIHFPQADDICFVCPIVFDWRPLTSIPHTYACMIAGVAIGLYEQPSDKSHWISMTGPAGKPFPSEPKKFPNRSLAEQWAADTLRLVFMAQTTETTMTPTEPTGPGPEPTDPKPGQQPPFDPAKQDDKPQSDFVNDPEPGEGDEDEIEDEVEDDDDNGDFE